MKKITFIAVFFLCIASTFAQIVPGWVSSDSSMMILEGGGTGWTFGGGSWSAAGQTWMGAGQVNNPPVDSAWAQLDLSSLAGKSYYIYVMWHKNGPYRPHAAHFEVYDGTGVIDSIVVDETKQANGLDLSNDAFSGWYLLGNKKIPINSTTTLRMFKDSTATSSEYMQSDAILLSKNPIIDNTSLGSVDDFTNMIGLSTSDIGPTGVGNHWGKQGLSEQYSTTIGDSAYAQLDTSIYSDVPSGNYYVEVSWVYYNTDSLNVTNAQYSVNDTLITDMINQNRSDTNQSGPFVVGNSEGTWSGFYRLSGNYYYSPSHPIKVGLTYNVSYKGRLVWNMVRFVPVTKVINMSVVPFWMLPDSSMMIIEGSGTGWTFGGGSWSAAGQTWMKAGEVNNPPVDSAWAEANLSGFAGKSKYIYIVWHVNGPYRGHAVHYEIYDASGVKYSTVVDETKHANGLALSNDTFSGWYCLGNKKINITPTTKLRIFKDSTGTPSEYVQSDAIMLTDYPVISSTSPGSVDNFEFMNGLSVAADTGGFGNGWGMQGLSEQFTFTSNDSAKTQLDTSIYSDAPAGYYYVDVSWVYYNLDSLNVMNAQYSVNGKLLTDTINQNRSAMNQAGPFVKGNSVGTWSGFHRLSGTYYYSPSNPLNVSAVYNNSLYSGYGLVWDMVRFVPGAPVTSIKEENNQIPNAFSLSQNYPNPFNPSTIIKYSLPISGIVTLKVYNLLGQEVATLVNQEQKVGNYNITFNAYKLASGVYLYRIQSGGFSQTKKMLLLK